MDMSKEIYNQIVGILNNSNGEEIANINGVYDVLREHFNNEALERIETICKIQKVVSKYGSFAMADVEFCVDIWHKGSQIYGIGEKITLLTYQHEHDQDGLESHISLSELSTLELDQVLEVCNKWVELNQ